MTASRSTPFFSRRAGARPASSRTTQGLAAAALGLVLGSSFGCGGSDDGGPVTLKINELMPSNVTSPCVDEKGGNADWIELYNTGTSVVNLEGLSISDDPEVPLKKKFGAGLSVPAGGVLLLWADDDVTQGPAHLPFKLAADKEQVLLYDRAGKELDRYSWTAAGPDLSYARLPDGSGPFSQCAIPTCGKLNGTTCGN